MLKLDLEYHLVMGSDRTKKQGNSRTFLANKSKERNMLIAKRFLSAVVKIHRKHPLSTATVKPGTQWLAGFLD